MTSGAAVHRIGTAAAAGELAWHTLGADQVLHSVGVNGQRGLSSAERPRGPAVRPEQVRGSPGRIPLARVLPPYRDPMQLVLLAAGIGSLYPLSSSALHPADLADAVQRGHRPASRGEGHRVRRRPAEDGHHQGQGERDGQLAEIPAGQLVTSDVVAIEAGDIVPADGGCEAATLEVDECA